MGYLFFKSRINITLLFNSKSLQKMKKVLLAFAVASIFVACNDSKTDTNSSTTDSLRVDSSRVDSTSRMGADTGSMKNYTDTGRINNSTDTSRKSKK